MRTVVKLSGLTDAESLQLVPEGGAAGLVVEVPGSPRSLTVEKAADLAGTVPPHAEVWAMVQDPATELIHRLFDDVGVDRVQVYGTIPPDLEFLEIHHLVPSLPIPLPGAEGPMPPIPPAEDYSRLHLDAAGDPLGSGSAARADWEMCARIVDSNPGRKLLLAGDISPETVVDALSVVRPWGIDASVGVEAAPGRLDPARVQALRSAIESFEKGGA